MEGGRQEEEEAEGKEEGEEERGGQASSSPQSPTPILCPPVAAGTDRDSFLPPSSVVHGHLPLLIGRENGEKAEQREGWERHEGNWMMRTYLCFTGRGDTCVLRGDWLLGEGPGRILNEGVRQ